MQTVQNFHSIFNTIVLYGQAAVLFYKIEI